MEISGIAPQVAMQFPLTCKTVKKSYQKYIY